MDDHPAIERHRRARFRLWTVLAIAALVVAFGLAVIIDTALYHGKIHAGVSIAGVDLGGLTEDEATQALTAYVIRSQSSSVTLVGAGRTFEFMLGRAGVRPDVDGAVEAAMAVTRESNFVVDLGRRFKLSFSGMDLPLEGLVNEYEMDALVADIAKIFDIPAVPVGLDVDDGSVTVVAGRKGSVVDRDVLREQLAGFLLSPETTDTGVPMVIEEPPALGLSNQDLVEAAETMISEPVTLTYGERSWVLGPDDIAAYLDVESKTAGGVSVLVPVFSSSKMSPLLDEIVGMVFKQPVNATFKSDGEMAWAEPGKVGRALDKDATVQALMAAALDPEERTAEAVVVEVEPELTAKKAEAMGIKTKLAGYKTVFDCPKERQQNVQVTTQYADKILAPGEVYDFDKQIGPRTEERGFALAPGIIGKGNLEDVLGGGICQVSTTVFNAVFEAGLEIIERHNHSLYIDHYPPGRDATVTDGGKNLVFRNDTDHYIWVHGWSNGITTIFNIYGTDDGRDVEWSWSGWTFGEKMRVEKYPVSSLSPGVTYIERAGQEERSCEVTRTVTMPDGTVLHNGPEVFTSDFKMVSRVVQVGASPTTTTTIPPDGTTETSISLPTDSPSTSD